MKRLLANILVPCKESQNCAWNCLWSSDKSVKRNWNVFSTSLTSGESSVSCKNLNTKSQVNSGDKKVWNNTELVNEDLYNKHLNDVYYFRYSYKVREL